MNLFIIKSINIQINMDNYRDHSNIVFLGNVDSSKSPSYGHLLYLMNAVDSRILGKCQQKASSNNRST